MPGRYSVGGEPAGSFPPEDLLERRSPTSHPVVQGRGLVRTPGGTVQVGKRDLVAEQVVLVGLGPVVTGCGELAEPGGVEGAQVEGRGAPHHPGGELAGGARTPGDSDLHSGAVPVVGEAGRGAEQHVAVGGMGDRSMDFLNDPGVGQHRHPLERRLEPRRNPVVFGREQVVVRLPRSTVLPHRTRIRLLVDADEARPPLHPDVSRYVGVLAQDRQFLVQVGEGRHLLGHEVLVGHGDHRQVHGRSGPGRHLAGIRAGGVDHLVANVRPGTSVSTLQRPSGKATVPVTLVLRLMPAPRCRAHSEKANTAPAGST